MIPLLLTLLLSFTSAYATYYAPGVFESVIAARQEWGQFSDPLQSEYYGYAASPDCSEVGNVVWLREAGADVFHPFLVADCLGADGVNADGTNWMALNNVAYELDYNAYVSFGGDGVGAVKIECLGGC